MKKYQIITRCGVVTTYDALSSYAACNMAREDGWSVLYVSPLIVKV